MTHHASSLILPLLAAAALLFPAPGAAERVATESRLTMGTLATVTVVGADSERERRAFAAAFAAFARVDEVMNEWREDSPLSALNRAAGTPGGVALPADLCAVLRAGLAGAVWSGGRFDPTWAALRDLWRFDGTGTVPSDEALAARCPLVSHRAVELRDLPGGGCEARLPRAGMALGLGGLAKGWGVDRAVAALRALGLRDFAVQAGGDLYAAGRIGGAPWSVGLRDPRGGPEERFATLAVSDAAFSTSGDYEHFFEADGRRWHHLIDPRTCRPATGSRSATVLAPTALEAELLTKAVFIAAGAEGLALAARRGAQAVLVTAENQVLFSPGLEGRLAWREPRRD